MQIVQVKCRKNYELCAKVEVIQENIKLELGALMLLFNNLQSFDINTCISMRNINAYLPFIDQYIIKVLENGCVDAERKYK